MLRRVYIIACVFLQDRKDERRRVWAFGGWNLDLRQFAWSPSSLTEPHLLAIFHRGFPIWFLFCFHFFWKMSTIERKGLVRIFRGYEHNGMTSKCSLRGWTRRNMEIRIPLGACPASEAFRQDAGVEAGWQSNLFFLRLQRVSPP